jgi:hypothetical protein
MPPSSSHLPVGLLAAAQASPKQSMPNKLVLLLLLLQALAAAVARAVGTLCSSFRLRRASLLHTAALPQRRRLPSPPLRHQRPRPLHVGVSTKTMRRRRTTTKTVGRIAASSSHQNG